MSSVRLMEDSHNCECGGFAYQYHVVKIPVSGRVLNESLIRTCLTGGDDEVVYSFKGLKWSPTQFSLRNTIISIALHFAGYKITSFFSDKTFLECLCCNLPRYDGAVAKNDNKTKSFEQKIELLHGNLQRGKIGFVNTHISSGT